MVTTLIWQPILCSNQVGSQTGVATKSNIPAIAECRHQVAPRRPLQAAEAANHRHRLLAATVCGRTAHRKHRDLLEPRAAARLGTGIDQGALRPHLPGDMSCPRRNRHRVTGEGWDVAGRAASAAMARDRFGCTVPGAPIARRSHRWRLGAGATRQWMDPSLAAPVRLSGGSGDSCDARGSPLVRASPGRVPFRPHSRDAGRARTPSVRTPRRGWPSLTSSFWGQNCAFFQWDSPSIGHMECGLCPLCIFGMMTCGEMRRFRC